MNRVVESINLCEEIFLEQTLTLGSQKATLIFGKNGSGKSTIARSIEQQLYSKYDVKLFQGYQSVLGSNENLNLVLLGEENIELENQIKSIEENNLQLSSKKASLISQIRPSENTEEVTLGDKLNDLESKIRRLDKKLEDFYSDSASSISNDKRFNLKKTKQYDKRNFKADIPKAKALTEEQIKEYIKTLNTEQKEVHEIANIPLNISSIVTEINDILKSSIEPAKNIERLNNENAIAFAKKGLEIHSPGDRCAFCGNIIDESTYNDLRLYFNAEQIKKFNQKVDNKLQELKIQGKRLHQLTTEINSENFYPKYAGRIKDIEQKIELSIKILDLFLLKTSEVLQSKLVNPFSIMDNIELKTDILFSANTISEEIKNYNEICKTNNNDNLKTQIENARQELRLHLVWKAIEDNPNYRKTLDEIDQRKLEKNQLLEDIKSIQQNIDEIDKKININDQNIKDLKLQTKNEDRLAENINKKLKHMVSFELVKYSEPQENKGYYRVKNLSNQKIRNIKSLSTGELNIIAFLYFLEKLNEETEENYPKKGRIIIFDDPMNSNDDNMQYLIIEELRALITGRKKKNHYYKDSDKIVILTHNTHFFINLKSQRKSPDEQLICLKNTGEKTDIVYNESESNFRTNYEALWNDFLFIYKNEGTSAELLLNPARRIIETFTKFNALNKEDFLSVYDGAYKLLNVNSHSIDDLEAELNGKSKQDIFTILKTCFYENGAKNHFDEYSGITKKHKAN